MRYFSSFGGADYCGQQTCQGVFIELYITFEHHASTFGEVRRRLRTPSSVHYTVEFFNRFPVG